MNKDFYIDTVLNVIISGPPTSSNKIFVVDEFVDDEFYEEPVICWKCQYSIDDCICYTPKSDDAPGENYDYEMQEAI